MWKFPWGQLLNWSCLFLLVPWRQARLSPRGLYLGRLVSMATQIKNDQSNPFLRFFLLFCSPRPQLRPSSVQVPRGRSLEARSSRFDCSQWIWLSEQHCRGMGWVSQILPKKSYIKKESGKKVKLTSDYNSLEGLRIMGSWDNWAQEHPMTLIFNPLKKKHQ